VTPARASARQFGPIEIRAAERQLRVDGKPVRLGVRAFGLLRALLHNRDRVVPRSELLAAVWPGQAVNENNLNVQIAALRKALGPNAVATIPGRGYRFTLPDDADPAAAPTPRLITDPLSNLPAPLAELLGRTDDLAQLLAMLPEQPLVTVVGAGGIGKTRVALEAARRRLQAHRDGVWWVELATLAADADADAVARAVAAAIGLNLGAGQAPTEALAAALRALDALVVLDNAEHVAQAAVTVVSALQTAPSLRWLVTSQVPLKLAQEQLFKLGTLSVPPADASFEQAMRCGALALLVHRARAINHSYQLELADLAAVIAICRRLDGIALAIEMAASRLAWIDAEVLNKRLARSVSGLGPGSRIAPTRQQTLQAALDWSHALLTPAERTVLRRLGVFVGGFTAPAAQQVAADESLDEWAVLDALFGLTEKSWVQVGEGTKPRYRLLESARLYALAQLGQEAGEESSVRSRHAEAMAAFSDGLTEIFWRERRDTLHALMAPESDNLAAAFDWALDADRASVAARLFVALVPAIFHSRAGDLQARADALRPRLAGLPPALAARALTEMGFAKVTFDVKASIALLREAQTVSDDAADAPYWKHFRFSVLSQCLSATGQHEEARAMAAQARAMQRPGWPGFGLAILGMAEVLIGYHSGDPEAAVAPARRTIELSEAVGALQISLVARTNLIATLVEMKRYDEAVQMAAELSPLSMSPRHRAIRLPLLVDLTIAYSRLGALDLAQRSAKEALLLTRTSGTRIPVLDCAAELALRQRRPEAAAQIIGHVQAAEAAGHWLSQPNQLRDRRATLDQLTLQLSADELAHWLARGATLRDDQIDALVGEEPSGLS
jgi:predicted ATPase/DNA-binding winged helix-turn-helix (wHTH) protein